jgi:hypothetical protein
LRRIVGRFDGADLFFGSGDENQVVKVEVAYVVFKGLFEFKFDLFEVWNQ